MLSPYEEVLGVALNALHPRLRPYFGAIPRGSVGEGLGVFEVVGTPRRWLWPALRLVAGHGVLFPTWQRDVRFTVANRPIVDHRGNIAVTAVRTFWFAGGASAGGASKSEAGWAMFDAITAERTGLVDHLGSTRRLVARLSASVTNGELRMISTALFLRVGRARIRIPSLLAPVVRLRERFDEESAMQRVAVTVDAPLIGRLYEYSGSFGYRIVPGGERMGEGSG